jgi:L-iditol 2-dehydrogenase
MKAALLYAVNDLRIVDIPVPAIGPADLLVQVSRCGVCPTDLRKYRTGDNGALKLPTNLGHEWVGKIIETGPAVKGFRPGMRVIGDTYAGYAEYALISAETIHLSFPNGPLRIPETVADDALIFVEPLADCLHAVMDQGQVQSGQTVVVLGAGQMGLQLVAVARHYGAQVIVSEPVAMRRELAREFGAAYLIDPAKQDVVRQVREFTDGRGADVVIVAIGMPSLVNQSLEMARPGGRVVLFAGFERPARVELDPNLIHYNEIVVTGSEWLGIPPHHRPELYQQAIDFITQGIVPVERLITGRFPLEQIDKAFAMAADLQSLKIIVQLK